MVSIWWVVVAFLVGGFASMLLTALMGMAAEEDEQAAKAEKAAKRHGLGSVDIDEEWIADEPWSARFG